MNNRIIPSIILACFLFWIFSKYIERITKGKGDNFDWFIKFISSAILFSACCVAIYSSIKAVELINSAETGEIEKSADLWQAVAALVQVPLLTVAAASFHIWSIRRNLSPQAVVGVYNVDLSRDEIDFSQPLQKYAVYTPSQDEFPLEPQEHDIDRYGVRIVVSNTGQKPLEAPRLKLTKVIPYLQNETWEGYFENYCIVRSTNHYGWRESASANIFKGEADDALQVNDIWSLDLFFSPPDDLHPVPFMFDLGLIRVQLWGNGLDIPLEEYLMIRRSDFTVDDKVISEIRNILQQREIRIKYNYRETLP